MSVSTLATCHTSKGAGSLVRSVTPNPPAAADRRAPAAEPATVRRHFLNRAAWLGVALVALVAVLGVADVSGQRLSSAVTADRVTIEKAARRLTLWRGEQVLKTYRVALGRRPVGDKVQQGDN